jgi:hypothetical protein
LLLAASAGVLCTAFVHVARAFAALDLARPAAEAEGVTPVAAVDPAPTVPAPDAAWAPAALALHEAAGQER